MRDPCATHAHSPPMEHPDQVLDSPHVRAVLPKAAYDDGAVPQQLSGRRTRLKTPGFKLHERMMLPDRPPLKDGSRSSPVHRFVLEASKAEALNVKLRREASERTSGVRRLFGESRSNRGGYHSIEEELVQGKPVWYDALLAEVILPAMRALNGQCMGGKDAVDARGVPLEGRLTGWLSVNDVHDCNTLHSHGLDVGWALVYYVSTGDEADGDDNAVAAAAATLVAVAGSLAEPVAAARMAACPRVASVNTWSEWFRSRSAGWARLRLQHAVRAGFCSAGARTLRTGRLSAGRAPALRLARGGGGGLRATATASL